MKTKIILDCDMGCDDAWCLITLLKCEQKCNLELLAITTNAGNTSTMHACQNALLVLRTLNRMDVKVYRGAESGLLVKKDYGYKFHGVDGFQDVFRAEEKPSVDLIQGKNGVEAMREIIEQV
jgi:purine nucleosidase